MPTTAGRLAKFDQRGNLTDSIITETGGGSIGIGTTGPSVRTQIEGTTDQDTTLAIRRADNNKFTRLGVGTQGVALDFDPTSFLVVQKNTSGVDGVLDGQELLRFTPDGNVGIGTPRPDRPLTVQGQGVGQELISFKDPSGATKWHINQALGGSNPGLNFVETGVADGRLFLQPEGNVGIGTTRPSTSLHVAGNLALDPGASPVLYTGTGDSEQNRYLQLINSPHATSASGLKAGGLLVADSYDFANPGKNDLVVKGSVGVGGSVTMDGTLTATSATIRTQFAGTNQASVVLDADVNGANVFIVSPRQPPGSGGIVQVSSVPGAPDNGAVFVTDVAGSATGITAKAGMFVDGNGRGVVMADIKNFRVPHPAQPDADIVYACIEGPEAAVYVRGTAHLINGEAAISLPDHFTKVASPEGMTIQVTPLSADSLGLAVVTKRLSSIEVKELHRGTGNYEFDWEVKCVRKGHEDYRVIRPRTEMAM